MLSTSLDAGSLIAPNLRLVRKLGEGGMGSVWVADHLTLKTPVAVKFMAEALAKDEAAVARFMQEATAAAQIKSRHVVRILDSGVTTWGVVYIVMELLEGEDLATRLARDAALSPTDTARIVDQTCKALAQAHRLGIVHRDIKPENIFLCEDDGEEIAKILDFGIAKREATESFSATSTGSMMGTPLYMSPEQVVSSKHVGPASDLWSVAVVAYQALTGATPFDGETMGAICVAIHAGAFDPVTARRPGLPDTLDAFFTRALGHTPAERFSSAKEMADAMLLAIGAPRSSIPSLEPSAGTLAPAAAIPISRSPSRRALVLAALALALVALAVIATRLTKDVSPLPVESPASTHAAAAPPPPAVSLSLPPEPAPSAAIATPDPVSTAAVGATPTVPTTRPPPTLPRRKNRGF